MSNSKRILAFIGALLAGNASLAASDTHNVPVATANSVDAMARLPPNLQKLLTAEMIAINIASQKIVDALVRGDTATVARQAQGIHDSFILEQQLSEQDRETLENTLPHDFLSMDATLHAKAQRLADVARRGDLELANFFFGRMIESCQTCHGRFAAGKFPGYAPQVQSGHHK